MNFKEREMDFREADRRYVELQRQYEARGINNEELDAELRRLMVRDEEGRWWAKDRQNGGWLYHDGNAWVAGTPPGVAPNLPPGLPRNPVPGTSAVEVPGVGRMEVGQLNLEISRGARFVLFQYCISVLILSFKRSSDVHYFRPGESWMGKMLPFTVLTLLLGWWGFPWGPIWTVQTAVTNLRGGKDVTQEVMASLD